MSKRAYDIFLFVGLAMVLVGLIWGWNAPLALVTVGGLIIGLTLLGAVLFAKRG